jgi:molybdate-binding protein
MALPQIGAQPGQNALHRIKAQIARSHLWDNTRVLQSCRAILTKGVSNTELTRGISPEYKLTVPIGEKIYALLSEANGAQEVPKCR